MNRVGYITKNKVNGGYTTAHKGYDLDDVPDRDVRCALVDAVCVQSKNSETRHWLANTSSDPYLKDSRRPSLITEDYGNYAKLKGKDLDGNEIYQLTAHMRQGTVIKQGERVHLRQVIGQSDELGTGNSSGGHTHTEFRTLGNVNIPVQFVEIDVSDPIEAPVFKWLLDLANENKIKQENIEGWIRDSLDKAKKQEADRDMLIVCETDKKDMVKDISELKSQLYEASDDVFNLTIWLDWYFERLEEANKPIPVIETKDDTPTTQTTVINKPTFWELLLQLLKGGD